MGSAPLHLSAGSETSARFGGPLSKKGNGSKKKQADCSLLVSHTALILQIILYIHTSYILRVEISAQGKAESLKRVFFVSVRLVSDLWLGGPPGLSATGLP